MSTVDPDRIRCAGDVRIVSTTEFENAMTRCYCGDRYLTRGLDRAPNEAGTLRQWPWGMRSTCC